MTRSDFREKVFDLLDAVDYSNDMIFNSPEEEEEVRTHLMEISNIL